MHIYYFQVLRQQMSDPGFSTAQLHALISGAPEVTEASSQLDPHIWERRLGEESPLHSRPPRSQG